LHASAAICRSIVALRSASIMTEANCHAIVSCYPV
jgi:hypothetical protein